MIYLDYAANTPPDPRVLETFVRTEQEFFGNANSTHPMGRAAKEEMTRITERIAGLLGCAPDEVIYTSGASESNNTAIKGIAKALRHKGRHIISTTLEHSSVGGCLTSLQEEGWEIDLAPIGTDGKIDLEEFRDLLRKDTVLVSVNGVDSELGTIQPIAELAAILKEYPGTRLHVDATQAVAKMDISQIIQAADTVSIAPHKFYGINGCGLLIKKKDLVIPPLIHGGASTTIYRSGTPTLGLAAGAECALRLALEGQKEWGQKVQMLRERICEALQAYPLVRFNSPKDGVPHILNVSVYGVKGSAFQQALSEEGVCVSVKSACSVENTPSKAVFAVSRDRKNALSSWRISLSHLVTDEEITGFLEAFDRCYEKLAKGEKTK